MSSLKVSAVTIEQRARVRIGEILPLQARAGQLVLERLHEEIHERVVSVAGNALVPPAKIFGRFQAVLIICSHIQDNGKGSRGVNAADQRIERELADGNAHASHALVADTQDAFAVGDHNDVHFVVWAVAQQIRNAVAQRIGNEQAARPAINLAEVLASERDYRCVHNGHQFFDVIADHPIEKRFVGVL